MRRQGDTYGTWTERAVADVATSRGLPDFVYRAFEIPKGSARREVADLLVWIGKSLLIGASKSRDVTAGASDSPERARNWHDKHIRKAIAQINGGARTLKDETLDLVLRSDRGVEVPWDPAAFGEMEVLGVVLVNSTPPANYYPPLPASGVPIIVMHAADWEEVHSRLLSAAAVWNYVSLRASLGMNVVLGAEEDVLFQVIRAENAGEIALLNADDLVAGRWLGPLADPSDQVFGSLPDHRFAMVVYEWIEAAAHQNPAFTSATAAHQYLQIIEFLDRIPLMHRVDLGKLVLDKCEEAGHTKAPTQFNARTPMGMLFFCSHPGPRRERTKWLQSYATARHTQLRESGGPSLTLGIATEPSPSDGRSHDFFLVGGDFSFSKEERDERDRLFGEFPEESGPW